MIADTGERPSKVSRRSLETRRGIRIRVGASAENYHYRNKNKCTLILWENNRRLSRSTNGETAGDGSLLVENRKKNCGDVTWNVWNTGCCEMDLA